MYGTIVFVSLSGNIDILSSKILLKLLSILLPLKQVFFGPQKERGSHTYRMNETNKLRGCCSKRKRHHFIVEKN